MNKYTRVHVAEIPVWLRHGMRMARGKTNVFVRDQAHTALPKKLDFTPKVTRL